GGGGLWKITRPTRGFAMHPARHTARDHAVTSNLSAATEKGSVVSRDLAGGVLGMQTATA
ncbi:hypothetical protein, partial [Actinomadura sp. NBRC 104412]|uniref:hypothetical protein n=1 Tax=Actinomadura sp. NBRC 104412 TaxID=3032203 RepID=UPI002555EDDB